MGKTVKGLILSAIASSVVMAGAYKIPEQSLNSMALSAAYVAHTMGADTAYANPANMVFMDGKQYIEGGLTLARLPSSVFNLGALSSESEEENILIPNFHYVSKPIGDFRWGVSITAPGGLTKRWKTAYQKLSAEEFTLKIVELNPSISYKVTDNFSIGGGLSLVYSEGVIKSDGDEFSQIPGYGAYDIKRDMEGDTFELGYNVAMTYKPVSDINLAVTYRSNVDLNEEGNAKLYNQGVLFYDGDASVSVPLPAALNIAVSKTWNDTFTLEFNYERTYWSKYKTLDFEYESPQPIFDDALSKNWRDTNIFRVGATVELDKITMMMAFAIDETPAPVETLGFELPDSDAKVFSMGFRYQQTEELSWGVAFLYDSKKALTVPAGVGINPHPAFDASFTEGGAFLTTVGIAYEF